MTAEQIFNRQLALGRIKRKQNICQYCEESTENIYWDKELNDFTCKDCAVGWIGECMADKLLNDELEYLTK